MPRFSKGTLQQLYTSHLITENIYRNQTTQHYVLHFHAMVLLLKVTFELDLVVKKYENTLYLMSDVNV